MGYYLRLHDHVSAWRVLSQAARSYNGVVDSRSPDEFLCLELGYQSEPEHIEDDVGWIEYLPHRGPVDQQRAYQDEPAHPFFPACLHEIHCAEVVDLPEREMG